MSQSAQLTLHSWSENLMFDIRKLDLPEILELSPRKFGDDRGFFSETFNRHRLAEKGIAIDWVQDNQSHSAEAYTLRGLHYQEPPFAQDKLVRVLRGRVLDVVVDIRQGAPSYGRWVALELSATAFNQILVPVGFAHGFLTLEPHTEVFYKVSAPYSRDHDRSIRFDDPAIGVPWPLNGAHPILSEKDQAAPSLAEAKPPFFYPGAIS
jgi:dTDP-4-dehydrorhamnose 3,5-epimerase